MRARRLVGAGAALLVLGSLTATADAGVLHPNMVSTRAVDYTPEVVSTPTVLKPHVDAIATMGATTFAGGLFDTISQGGQTYQRGNVVAFDTASNAVSEIFKTTVAVQRLDEFQHAFEILLRVAHDRELPSEAMGA